MRHYDVIIIGSGAGGGTLAYQLAPSGKKILLLERGDYVRREKDNWSSRAVNVEAKYHTKEVWQDKDGRPLHPHTNYYVGGNTKFYGAALFRLRQEDFGELNHHGGLSPAWPLLPLFPARLPNRPLLALLRAALSARPLFPLFHEPLPDRPLLALFILPARSLFTWTLL